MSEAMVNLIAKVGLRKFLLTAPPESEFK